MIYTVTVNPAIDYVMHPLTLDMGYTNRSSAEELRCGGNGINVSTILTELKIPTTALGIAGGFTGDYLIESLQEQGIPCNFVKLERGNTRINIKLQGIVMSMVNGMGPAIPLRKVEELIARMDCIGEGDTVVLTGSIPASLPDDLYDMIMRRMENRGIRFVVDAPGTLLLQSLSAKPFLIKPNNHELGRLFDVHPELPEECLPYARLLHERGAQNVLVSCGKHGAALLDENGNEHIVLTPKIKLVNATGAGDSMVAGFLAMVEKGESYEQALRFASTCGSATAASKGLASKEKIMRLYDDLNERMAKHEAELKERIEVARATIIDPNEDKN